MHGANMKIILTLVCFLQLLQVSIGQHSHQATTFFSQIFSSHLSPIILQFWLEMAVSNLLMAVQWKHHCMD